MGDQGYGPPPSGDPVWNVAQPPVLAQDPARRDVSSPGPPPASPMPAAYPPPYPQPYPAAYPQAYPPPYPPPLSATATDKNWMGIASLVLSLVGAWPLGVIFGILGINAASKGRANNRTMSIWGASLGVAWVIAIVGVSAVFGFGSGSFFGDRTTYTGLAVGDCIEKPTGWDDAGSDLKAARVTRVSCDTQHWGQVYYRDVIGGASYPGDAAVQASAEKMCSSATAAANIAPEHVDQVVVSYVMPSAKSWVANNRNVICFASDKQHALTSSWVVGPEVTRA